jgi:hypothetical protein
MPTALRRPYACKPWTPEETETLRRLAGAGVPPRLIAERLGRSVGAVSTQAGKFGISLAPKAARRGGAEDPPPG